MSLLESGWVTQGVREALGRLALLGAVGWGAFGCGETTDGGPGYGCTDIGCLSSLEFTIADDGGEAGNRDDEYVVTVTVGERIGTCTLVIVETAAESERSNECTGDVPIELGSTDDFTGFTINEAPETVHVVVTLDGATVYDETVTPEYTTSQPNGPDCPPVCQSASVPIELDIAG